MERGKRGKEETCEREKEETCVCRWRAEGDRSAPPPPFPPLHGHRLSGTKTIDTPHRPSFPFIHRLHIINSSPSSLPFPSPSSPPPSPSLLLVRLLMSGGSHVSL